MYLQYSDGEVCSGLCGEPQPELWVGLGQLLQSFLQLLQPVYEQVAVLEHEPVASLCSCLQQLQGHLWGGKTATDTITVTQDST